MALVTSDPELCGGTPCFAGTRVPVKYLFDWLRGGHTIGEVVENFPTVESWQAQAVVDEAQVEIIRNVKRESVWTGEV